MRCGWHAALAVVCGCVTAVAAEPVIEYLFPAGGQIGTHVSAVCGTQFEHWPVSVWTDDPALVFRPGATNGSFEVEIGPGALVGPHLVRAYNKDGASAPALFVVGEFPELVRRSDATNQQAEVVTRFPAVLNGRIAQAEHVDTFKLNLPGNCSLKAEVCAVGLDSSVRATIELVDAASNRVISVEPQLWSDPKFEQHIGTAGIYLLSVAGASDDTGTDQRAPVGDGAVYRMLLRTDPARPTAAQAVDLNQPVREIVEAFRPMVAVRTLMMPGLTRGVVAPAGRQINYGFDARAQERFSFRVLASSIGSPLAPVLRILNADMSQIAEAPPGGDVGLVWVAPEAGSYIVAVSDAEGGGGPLCAFQLEAAAPEPFFRATVSAHAFRLAPGASIPVSVGLVKPAGSGIVLQLAAAGLPNGVSTVPQTASPDTGEVRLVLIADENAAPANVAFRLSVLDVGAVPPRLDFAKAALKGRHAPTGALLINETDQLWLTVAP